MGHRSCCKKRRYLTDMLSCEGAKDDNGFNVGRPSGALRSEPALVASKRTKPSTVEVTVMMMTTKRLLLPLLFIDQAVPTTRRPLRRQGQARPGKEDKTKGTRSKAKRRSRKYKTGHSARSNACWDRRTAAKWMRAARTSKIMDTGTSAEWNFSVSFVSSLPKTVVVRRIVCRSTYPGRSGRSSKHGYHPMATRSLPKAWRDLT